MAAGRRAVPVLAATVGSLALLSRFHTTPQPTGVVATVPSTGAPTSTSSSSPQPAPTTTRAATPRTTTPTTQAVTTQAIAGPTLMTQFGPVQVEIWRRAGHLVDVRALQLPNSHAQSVEISDYAAPRLRQEALQAQSANIDIISGATYTSEGYIESLQGAIDARG